MKNSLLIAINSFKDAKRQKIILLFAFIAIVLILLSNYFSKMNLGTEQLSFVADFGAGALSFFGVIIAIVATAQLIHSEYDNKSLYVLVSKPISHFDFIVGKFFGISFLLALYTLCVAVLTFGFLYYLQIQLSKIPEELLIGGHREINVLGFASYAFLQWLKLSLICAISILVCTVSRSMMFSVIISFTIFGICLLSSIASEQTSFFYVLIKYIFPDISIFDKSQDFIFSAVNIGMFLSWAIYAIVYIVFVNLLASYLFSKRQL